MYHKISVDYLIGFKFHSNMFRYNIFRCKGNKLLHYSVYFKYFDNYTWIIRHRDERSRLRALDYIN